MSPPNIDWQATLAQHDRWLRTVAVARGRERQAVDEVMQEVALAAVKQAAPWRTTPRSPPGCIGWSLCNRSCIGGSAGGGES